MKKELPIYKMLISESSEDKTEVNYVALVDDPAIQMMWQKFDKQKEFSFQADKERNIITGVLMVADLPIYRRDERMGEYYVVFDKENIEKAAIKYFKKGYMHNVNLMHDSKAVVDGVFMFESFLVDSKRGIQSPKGFEGLPDGSWVASYKVENLLLWDKLESFNGFSVEGLFGYELEMTEDEKVIKKIIKQIHS